MASATTINGWMDDLANSILQQPKRNVRTRKQLDNFRRRVRYHNFGRTNQFDVRNRLDGLEERLQILDRDDLSDALYGIRVELRDHDYTWLPDILDLLLQLSRGPTSLGHDPKDEDGGSNTSIPSSPKATYHELFSFDRDDPIWRIPAFDASSSDDEASVLSTATTPSLASVKKRGEEVTGPPQDLARLLVDSTANEEATTTISSITCDAISELHIVRETLLMVQGYPTTLFISDKRKNLSLKHGIKLKGVSAKALHALLNKAIIIRKDVEFLNSWIKMHAAVDYVQLIQQSIAHVLDSFVAFISRLAVKLVHPSSIMTVSLLHIVTQLEDEAGAIRATLPFVQQADASDAVGCITLLYEILCEQYLCSDESGYRVLLPVFINAFDSYMKPLKIWLNQGRLSADLQPCFIVVKTQRSTMSKLWYDWYELSLEGLYRPPDFLIPFADQVFACGKTSAFIEHVAGGSSNHEDLVELANLINDIHTIADDSTIPFSAAFEAVLSNCFAAILRRKTRALKLILDNQCGLVRTLDALSFLYLRKNGVIVDGIETIIFNRMDRCLDNWNDRYLLADMLEDAYTGTECVDLDAIVVHSARTSSRNMDSRRRSVKTLGAMAIEYMLPWAIANIITKESMAAYWRVSLHLIQIRRAKYVLERVAYLNVNSYPVSEDPREQKHAHLLTFLLLNFVNTLYDHFTATVVGPMTTKMRDDLSAAQTVDDMVSVHTDYVARLERACFTTSDVKMLKETLTGLLDMCIRFSDLISSPAVADLAARTGSDDFETSSFKSARSNQRRRRHRMRGKNTMQEHEDEAITESSSEQGTDDEGEGHSSFVVLGENTTIAKEIVALQNKFRRQLDFFVAGVRGVGKGGRGDVVEATEVLAERLTWKVR